MLWYRWRLLHKHRYFRTDGAVVMPTFLGLRGGEEQSLHRADCHSAIYASPGSFSVYASCGGDRRKMRQLEDSQATYLRGVVDRGGAIKGYN